MFFGMTLAFILSGYPPEDPRQTGVMLLANDHWEDLPYAIYPSPEKHASDQRLLKKTE